MKNYFVLIGGANHFSIVDKIDHTMARSFLDNPEQQESAQIKDCIFHLVFSFLQEIRNQKVGLVEQQLQRFSSLIEEQRLR